MEISKQAKRPCLAAFIDVEGAFNNTSREAIVRGMMDLGISPVVVRWVDNYLGRRILTTYNKATSVSKHVSNGCPQGSVCSPIYCNIAQNVLLRQMRERYPFFLVQAFAGDICIAASGICRKTIRDQIKTALLFVRGWCASSGLNLNIEKTELLWVDNSRNPPPKLTIRQQSG